jgi:hypothetical protein
MHKCWTLNSTIPFLLALFGHHPNLDDSHLKMYHSCAKLAHGSTVENNKTQRVLFWTTCTRAVLDLPRWTQTFHIHICAGCCLFATQIISAMPYDPYDLAMGLWGTTSLTVYWFFETIWCHWAVGIFHPRRLVELGSCNPSHWERAED